ncbi:high frequency lysogenization protein HflD [Pasteurellaceae bacterium LIM206]|nr:high frequency lysogenization protein HflD [Pasteurellaceae bacterium LIM206]
MAANYYEITLALAGVCQSAKLVQQFAVDGSADGEAFKTSVYTLLQTSPDSILSIYGGHERNLKLGLETLLQQLNGKAEDLTRYWLNLLALSGKLEKNIQAKSELARRIQYLPSQLVHYDLFDEQMISNMASMYVDIISPLGNKIQIKGTPQALRQLPIQNRVRTCLLAGIRSALLWRQVGGTKWQMLFHSRKIFNMAKQIYSSI